MALRNYSDEGRSPPAGRSGVGLRSSRLRSSFLSISSALAAPSPELESSQAQAGSECSPVAGFSQDFMRLPLTSDVQQRSMQLSAHLSGLCVGETSLRV